MKLMLRGVYLHPSGQMPAYRVELQRREPPGSTPSGRSSCTAPEQACAAR